MPRNKALRRAAHYGCGAACAGPGMKCCLEAPREEGGLRQALEASREAARLEDAMVTDAQLQETELRQALEASRRAARAAQLEDEELARVERLSKEAWLRDRDCEDEAARDLAVAERLSAEAWQRERGEEEALRLALELSAAPAAAAAVTDAEAEQLALAVGASIVAAAEDSGLLAALAAREEAELAQATQASLAAARHAWQALAADAGPRGPTAAATEVHCIADDGEDAGSTDGLDDWWLSDEADDQAWPGDEPPRLAAEAVEKKPAPADDDDDWVVLAEPA